MDKFSRDEEVNDQLAKVIQQLKHVELMHTYQLAKKKLKEDTEAQRKILAFQKAKDKFTKVETYGKWAPDYEEKRLELVKAQKSMNDEPSVFLFKQKEKELAYLLDELSVKIFRSIFPEIPIDFQSGFQLGQKVGGCSCGTGCKCK